MIIITSIYVIFILFNCSHHVHVIFKNPSRYKTGSKDHDIDHRRHPAAAIDPSWYKMDVRRLWNVDMANRPLYTSNTLSERVRHRR